MQRGLDRSRQWETSPEMVSLHHYLRYEFASKVARGRVLDAACGVGYGTSMLYHATGSAVGIDYDLEAIEWAKKYFPGPEFIHGTIESSPWAGEFDTVVSLETIEHIAFPYTSMKALRAACRGKFIASVPNEELYPFNPNDFLQDKSPHHRHYTPQQFEEFLNENHFRVSEKWCQVSKQQPELVHGTHGKFLIFVCD